jgi:hypothetical protein
MMRAKLAVVGVQKLDYGEILNFCGVSKCDGYPLDGSDENNTYAKFSPCVSLQITIQNPALYGKFEAGDEFYVDFTLAKKKGE